MKLAAKSNMRWRERESQQLSVSRSRWQPNTTHDREKERAGCTAVAGADGSQERRVTERKRERAAER